MESNAYIFFKRTYYSLLVAQEAKAAVLRRVQGLPLQTRLRHLWFLHRQTEIWRQQQEEAEVSATSVSETGNGKTSKQRNSPCFKGNRLLICCYLLMLQIFCAASDRDTCYLSRWARASWSKKACSFQEGRDHTTHTAASQASRKTESCHAALTCLIMKRMTSKRWVLKAVSVQAILFPCNVFFFFFSWG